VTAAAAADDDDDVNWADTGSFPAIDVCFNTFLSLLILIRCWVNRYFLCLVCQNWEGRFCEILTEFPETCWTFCTKDNAFRKRLAMPTANWPKTIQRYATETAVLGMRFSQKL